MENKLSACFCEFHRAIGWVGDKYDYTRAHQELDQLTTQFGATDPDIVRATWILEFMEAPLSDE